MGAAEERNENSGSQPSQVTLTHTHTIPGPLLQSTEAGRSGQPEGGARAQPSQRPGHGWARLLCGEWAPGRVLTLAIEMVCCSMAS